LNELELKIVDAKRRLETSKKEVEREIESFRKEETLKFLEKNLSSEPSTFAEEAKWRQENEVWLKWSQGIAMKIIDYMQEHKLSRADIASRLGCSPQYVSKILSGHTNFSFKSIAEIEKCLNIRIMETSFA